MIFSPTNLANLWGWYDAGAGVTGTTNVTGWADQSGNNRNLASVATKEPRLVTNVINNLPVITPRVGVGANLITAANFPATDFTVFIVGSQSVAASPLTDNNGVYLYSAVNDMNVVRPGVTNKIGGAVFGLEQNAVDNTFYTIRNKYLATGANGYYLALNNGTEGYAALTPGGITPSPINVLDNGFSEFGNKRIAEIIIYTRGLTAGEVTQVETYLRTKYAHY